MLLLCCQHVISVLLYLSCSSSSLLVRSSPSFHSGFECSHGACDHCQLFHLSSHLQSALQLANGPLLADPVQLTLPWLNSGEWSFSQTPSQHFSAKHPTALCNTSASFAASKAFCAFASFLSSPTLLCSSATCASKSTFSASHSA